MPAGSCALLQIKPHKGAAIPAEIPTDADLQEAFQAYGSRASNENVERSTQ
jgi:hypothetical protein